MEITTTMEITDLVPKDPLQVLLNWLIRDDLPIKEYKIEAFQDEVNMYYVYYIDNLKRFISFGSFCYAIL